jgi:hypothetical protein
VEKTARWLYNIDPEMRIKLIGFRHNGVRPQFLEIPEADPQHLETLSEVIRKVGFADLVVV